MTLTTFYFLKIADILRKSQELQGTNRHGAVAGER